MKIRPLLVLLLTFTSLSFVTAVHAENTIDAIGATWSNIGRTIGNGFSRIGRGLSNDAAAVGEGLDHLDKSGSYRKGSLAVSGTSKDIECRVTVSTKGYHRGALRAKLFFHVASHAHPRRKHRVDERWFDDWKPATLNQTYSYTRNEASLEPGQTYTYSWQSATDVPGNESHVFLALILVHENNGRQSSLFGPFSWSDPTYLGPIHVNNEASSTIDLPATGGTDQTDVAGTEKKSPASSTTGDPTKLQGLLGQSVASPVTAQGYLRLSESAVETNSRDQKTYDGEDYALMSFYRTLLGRRIDEYGLAYYRQRLEREGASLTEVRAAISNSPEAQVRRHYSGDTRCTRNLLWPVVEEYLSEGGKRSQPSDKQIHDFINDLYLRHVSGDEKPLSLFMAHVEQNDLKDQRGVW